MTDPYEEERRARFVQPIGALLNCLGLAMKELMAAQKSRDPQESVRLYDHTLNMLFNVLNLALPVAHVRQKNGRTSFVWLDYADRNAQPSFRWVVCFPDGSFRSGREDTQEVCEAVAEKCLQGT